MRVGRDDDAAFACVGLNESSAKRVVPFSLHDPSTGRWASCISVRAGIVVPSPCFSMACDSFAGSTVQRVSVCGREQSSRPRTDGPGKQLGFVPSTAGQAFAFTSNAIAELIHRYRTRQPTPRWAGSR